MHGGQVERAISCGAGALAAASTTSVCRPMRARARVAQALEHHAAENAMCGFATTGTKRGALGREQAAQAIGLVARGTRGRRHGARIAA